MPRGRGYGRRRFGRRGVRRSFRRGRSSGRRGILRIGHRM